MRQEFVISPVEKHCYDRLKGLADDNGLALHFDEELLFWDQHFRGLDGRDWAVYDNGVQKGGTVRYKTGKVRIPMSAHLNVYQTQEHEAGAAPRGRVYVPKFVVCTVEDFYEHANDGFASLDEVVPSMQTYYPDFNENSLFTFYPFERTEWYD